ncbi:Tetraacyldisaccharide 4'-kinase [compost metagenome]
MALQRSNLEDFLTRTWAQRGLAACMLLPVSALFGGLSALRRVAYQTGLSRSERLPVPVVVVGNIFVGGTGKTPLTIWLVHALRQAGYTPGVISRGYGVQNAVPQAVTAQSRARDVGDEPLLIAYRAECPVMVGRDRVAVATALLAAHPQVDVLISDDGLQHYRMARDVEIVLFDGRGAGNGWLLPAGPLREPTSRRRDFTVLNGAASAPGLGPDVIHMQLLGATAEKLNDRSQISALSSFVATAGQRAPTILAAAGIGNPGRFFGLLRGAGLQFEEMALPDHYDFAENPFAHVSADVILITEKDAVKCRQNEGLRNDSRLWVVPVTAQLDGALAEKIVEKLRGRSIA